MGMGLELFFRTVIDLPLGRGPRVSTYPQATEHSVTLRAWILSVTSSANTR